MGNTKLNINQIKINIKLNVNQKLKKYHKNKNKMVKQLIIKSC